MGDSAPRRSSGGRPRACRGDLRTLRSCTPLASGSQPPAEPVGGCGEGPARSPPAALGEAGKGWPRGGEFPQLFSPTNSSACAIREICLTNSRGSGAGRWGGAWPGALLAQARSLPARAFDQRRASLGERSGSLQPDSGRSRAVPREAPRPLRTSCPQQPPALATCPRNQLFTAPSACSPPSHRPHARWGGTAPAPHCIIARGPQPPEPHVRTHVCALARPCARHWLAGRRRLRARAHARSRLLSF